MAKRKDEVQIAKSIYDQFLAKNDPASVPATSQPARPNPKAEAGRKGGLKGGKARAASLSPHKRKQIAKKAAKARWNS
jgi:hypothetical protein